jgi:hypothetical protein
METDPIVRPVRVTDLHDRMEIDRHVRQVRVTDRHDRMEIDLHVRQVRVTDLHDRMEIDLHDLTAAAENVAVVVADLRMARVVADHAEGLRREAARLAAVDRSNPALAETTKRQSVTRVRLRNIRLVHP